MYEPRIPLTDESGAVRRVVRARAIQIKAETPMATVLSRFDDTRALMEVEVADRIVKVEFVEPSSVKEAFDEDYLSALERFGHIALHYPSAHFNDIFVESKASSLRREAMERKITRPLTIDGFTYEQTGVEDRVV